MKDYKEQWKSPKWQKKRLEIMQRDDFKCQICKHDDYTLNVHHAYYAPKRMVWDYPNYVLITLCDNCHKQMHDKAFSLIPNRYSFIANQLGNIKNSERNKYYDTYIEIVNFIGTDDEINSWLDIEIFEYSLDLKLSFSKYSKLANIIFSSDKTNMEMYKPVEKIIKEIE